MAKTSIYNYEGQSVGQMELPDRLFAVTPDPALVHEAVIAQRANARHAIAATQTKGMVHGGGKKPWKQKGTGRARQGSIRSPQWKGGGVVFGPSSERNFSLKMNRKAKRKALSMVLTDKLMREKLIVLETIMKEPVKTKTFLAMMQKLPVDRTTLMVLGGSDPVAVRMARNLPFVKVVTVNSLNMLDLLTYRSVVFLKDAISALEQIYA